jgi:NAD(P)H dehydrogenase (quinone)
MIVVSAATGEFGRLVVERLLDSVDPSEVAVAVRDPAKADRWAERGVDVRFGNYDDAASLEAAFGRTDQLLFISGPVAEDVTSRRVDQHRNVVDAATRAGVGRIVYTSGLGADAVEEGVLGEHHATERMIAESGWQFTFLRHPIYHDFFVTPYLQQAVDAGELTSNTGGRGLNTATRADLAEAAAAVLTNEEHNRGAYDFTGRLWSYPELAQVLTDVTGRPVQYRETDTDDGIVGMLGLAEFIRSGGFEYQSPDLEHVLGHPPMSLRDTVEQALKAH